MVDLLTIDTLLYIVMAVLVLAMALLAVRFVMGPTVLDQLVVLESLLLGVLCIAAVYSVRLGTGYFFEVIVLASIIGFISSVAIARYIERGDIFSDDDDPAAPQEDTSHDR